MERSSNKPISGLSSCLCLLLAVSLPLPTDAQNRAPRGAEVAPPDSPAVGNWCKRRSTGRIVGGTAAAIDDWPGLAALRSRSKQGGIRYFCGASAITPNLLLTAAHCVERWKKGQTGSWETQDGGIVEVVLGADDIHAVSPEKVRQVADRMIHEKWTGRPQDGNDIALVRLASQWNGPLSRLSSSLLSDSAQRAYAAGFGLTMEKESGGATVSWESAEGTVRAGSQTLQEVLMPVVSGAICKRPYRTLNEHMQLCAGYDAGGMDSCNGDSGGPLDAIDTQGCAYQIGVVSFGNGCARKTAYGVYTRVSSYVDWIRAQAGDPSLAAHAPVPEAAGVATSQALDALIDRLKAAEGVVQVRMVPASRLRLGQLITFEIETNVEGSPILIDENARGEITQLFPNREAAAAGAIRLKTDRVLRLPPPGARYSFKALPPTGAGRLVGLIMPRTVTLDRSVAGTPMLERGIGVVEAEPANYTMNVAQQLITAIDGPPGQSTGPETGSLSGWGMAVVKYTIEP